MLFTFKDALSNLMHIKGMPTQIWSGSFVNSQKRKQNKAYYIKKYVPTRELLFQLRRWWINMKKAHWHIIFEEETYNMKKNLHTKGIEQTMNKKKILFCFLPGTKIYIRKRISSIRIFGISWQCKSKRIKKTFK